MRYYSIYAEKRPVGEYAASHKMTLEDRLYILKCFRSLYKIKGQLSMVRAA